MNKLYLVGLGSGNLSGLTGEARAALISSEVICGYSLYLSFLKRQFPRKIYLETPMREEMRRCRLALQSAAEGKTTALVGSGDAGVYGLAGPALALLEEYPKVEAEVVPGVTAALSGAALLGAPLTNDFCVVSLSDILTPWSLVIKRLKAAAEGDFTICLYNPSSRRRQARFTEAIRILLSLRDPETPCGWVRNAGRAGTEKKILTLASLAEAQPDMLTTVFIGCSQTIVKNGYLITRRGYAGETDVPAIRE